jgi:hypothetical protein
MEDEGEEAGSLRGKLLCAAVEGFSLHAAQAVAAEDREALERMLRYGLRAPFSQQRPSVREDGKVVYRLRRPCVVCITAAAESDPASVGGLTP